MKYRYTLADTQSLQDACKEINDRYGLTLDSIIHPADMVVDIYNDTTRGIYWARWNDFNDIHPGIWVLTSTKVFVQIHRIHIQQDSGVMCVFTRYGNYTNLSKRFSVKIPLAKLGTSARYAKNLRANYIRFFYTKAVKDMAVLMSHGTDLNVAFRVAFRDNRFKSISLGNVLRNPDLVEELKVALQEAFKRINIDENWLAEQLKLIAENPDHREQFNVLLLIGRAIGSGIDAYVNREPDSWVPLISGGGVMQEVNGIEEAQQISAPDAVLEAIK